MNNEIFEVPCPICKKPVIWSKESLYRPFCSKRCQLIDLGEWAAEEKAIPSDTADFATNENFDEDWR
ncbi:hypothetical protein EV697_10917 [Bisgaardia hudsonensis]|uniref:DNA gyrase inhibitor YacG n=1 Tax=Bisgaardia hudsonensis TaxID=109472 RepID=A0A4R2MU37_9PAST|nr:DNA gyrase inhibitor YacG [Bisgaardia hudsonensis]QLB13543.1 DNA gyrase inhibitor [Bisgaardia hudsonensis]TCP11167.1 hypothetical protein EV697_10917 [Bisgaardia hudsonensis]